MSGCPDPSRLMAFMDGELHGAEASAVRSHIGSCQSCRRMVEKQMLIEKSYRDSFEIPSDESFRLMERRIMASVQAPARKRLPAFVPIAAALLIAAVGVRLAGRAGLLERPTVETITVTSSRDGIEPPGDIFGDSSAGAVSIASESIPEQTGLLTGEGLALQEQQTASSDAEQADAALPAVQPLQDEDTYSLAGGSGGLIPGAGCGAVGLSEVATAGSTGAVSQTVGGQEENGCFESEAAAGRICDTDYAVADLASDESGIQTVLPGTEGDVCGGPVDVLARGSISADQTVSTCETPREALSPCPFGAAVASRVLIIFDAEGEPASPDSLLLDSCLPGWKDSLAGSMLDTAFVVTCEELQDLAEKQGAD